MKLHYHYIILFFICIGTHISHAQTIPSNITGLKAWFSADSIKVGNGNPIDTVKSINNPSIIVIQPNATNQPLLIDNGLNSKPVMRFDGINDYLNGGDSLDYGNTGQTAFLVGKSNSVSGSFFAKSNAAEVSARYGIVFSANNLYYVYQDNTPHYLFTPCSLNAFHIISSTTNNQLGKAELFLDGISKKIDNTLVKNYNMNSTFYFFIGAYNNNTNGKTPPLAGFYLNGDIAEIVIYNRTLSQLERQQIENYLRLKYFPGTERLQFSLGPDINEPYSLTQINLTVPPQAYYTSYLWNTGETTSSISTDSSGTYTVKVMDNWGYEYYDTIQVTKPSITPMQGRLLCKGEKVTWDCGISGAYTYEWNTGATTQSIDINDAGKYAIKVTDTNGDFIVSDTATFTIDDFTTEATLGADTALCKGNKIALTKRKADAVDYIWNTGATTPEITFTNTGNYSVIATNANGCKIYDTITILTKGIAPNVTFTTTNICDGQTTQLEQTATTTDGTFIIGSTWYINNDTLLGNTINYIFPNIGENQLKLVVETNVNCFGVLDSKVDISPNPVVSFIPPKACENGITEFTSTSQIVSGTLQSYLWTIEGEQFSGNKVPYTFTSTGTFPIKLDVTSNMGCTSTYTKNIVIREAPKIEFVSTKTCQNEPVFFFDKTTYKPYNTSVDGNWIIDGDKYNYDYSIGGLFDDTDEHIITLEVKTVNGCLNSKTDTIQMHPAPTTSFPPLYGCVNKDFLITDNSNTFGDTISRYLWIIDSIEYRIKNPIVEFKDTGTYSVQLFIETENQCLGSDSSSLHIETTPTADFTFSPEFGAVPIEIEFTNHSIKANSYKWNFELVGESNEENPTYIFTDKVNPFAKLYAYSTHGCVDSLTRFIPIQLSDAKLSIVDYEIISTGYGFNTYQVEVLNTGNATIQLIEFVIDNPEFPEISEQWKGSLPIGDALTYTFTAKIKANEDEQIPYACIYANLITAHEYKVYYTDSYCKDFSNKYGIYRITPNPASTIAVVKFNTTIAGNVTLECMDESGRKFIVEEYQDLQPGYHSKTIDVSKLSAGTYLCKLTQNKNIDVKYFIKNDLR